jgi:hypothetical protein
MHIKADVPLKQVNKNGRAGTACPKQTLQAGGPDSCNYGWSLRTKSANAFPAFFKVSRRARVDAYREKDIPPGNDYKVPPLREKTVPACA